MAEAEKSVQQKYQQFLQLLPLTLNIAGLPESDHGRYFNDDQMELRCNTIKLAYKQARRVAREAIQE